MFGNNGWQHSRSTSETKETNFDHCQLYSWSSDKGATCVWAIGHVEHLFHELPENYWAKAVWKEGSLTLNWHAVVL